MRLAELTHGLRFAIGTLSAVPVRVERVDREVAGRAMVAAPAVGLALGAAAGLPLLLPGPPLLGAALALGLLAVLTRGLHLDGLADLADGLGSGKPAAAALDIMKKSDIGPFGVMTLVITLLVQAAALTGTGYAALVTACVAGRLALTWACRASVPAARPGGLGAMVAGTVSDLAAWLTTLAALVVTAGVGLATGTWVPPFALAAGLVAALLLLRHARRRLGGITGDVLGALVETGTATALAVSALAA
ncbi:adenosylcobinamide-GDP ribazoletransferase [Nonomuraea spiralis]|uniref:adenosylcobinamide-GDP ribazoletransferase n=1 Tax=Nonomuraea TaxID=83681 RepID=UPI000F7A7337|nr:adenosylcobinamide-GDP ribazoletransferase [Nonomuraea sp. WAC 01424]RSN16044.1 adenosylcobinamide-GDP ribazoletransferase [Nonomuraea sp. WAC 01424]